jgi:hypothetical protein
MWTKGSGYGKYLSQRSVQYLDWVWRNQGKSSIHRNSKTGLSIDFDTSCQMRELPGKEPCLYCYVDHGRVAKKEGLHFLHGKSVTENPYNGEIKYMPRNLINKFNQDGGMRMFSFGDYRPGKDLRNVEGVLNDAQKRGLYIKAITKEPQFIKDHGNHPNLRANISVDNINSALPGASNSLSIEEAVKLKAGRENIKIRAVALNEAEGEMYAKDPRIDVVTLYHGFTGDKLLRIIEKQNPKIIEQYGREKVKAYTDTWQNMPHRTEAFKRLAEEAPTKLCCQSGKCAGDRTKCGFGVAGLGLLLLGVDVELDFEE